MTDKFKQELREIFCTRQGFPTDDAINETIALIDKDYVAKTELLGDGEIESIIKDHVNHVWIANAEQVYEYRFSMKSLPELVQNLSGKIAKPLPKNWREVIPKEIFLSNKQYTLGYNNGITDCISALEQLEKEQKPALKCVCGNPEALGVVHMVDKPCFVYLMPAEEKKECEHEWMDYAMHPSKYCRKCGVNRSNSEEKPKDSGEIEWLENIPNKDFSLLVMRKLNEVITNYNLFKKLTIQAVNKLQGKER